MLVEPYKTFTQGPVGWQMELSRHQAPKRPKPSDPLDVAIERCVRLTRCFMECATSPDGRTARQARDMHAGMIESYGHVAQLALRDPEVLERIGDTDARAAVETIMEKLQANMMEGNEDDK